MRRSSTYPRHYEYEYESESGDVSWYKFPHRHLRRRTGDKLSLRCKMWQKTLLDIVFTWWSPLRVYLGAATEEGLKRSLTLDKRQAHGRGYAITSNTLYCRHETKSLSYNTTSLSILHQP